MLNIRTDKPVREDVYERVQNIFAQMRDLLLEAEQTMAIGLNERVFLTRAEVASMLRCPENKIPRQIPRIRSGGQWIFESSDVNEFIDSKKRKS